MYHTNRDEIRAAVLAYIRKHIEGEGYPPTYEQIAVAVGFSPNSGYAIKRYLDELEAAGHLTRKPFSPRSIRLTEQTGP